MSLKSLAEKLVSNGHKLDTSLLHKLEAIDGIVARLPEKELAKGYDKMAPAARAAMVDGVTDLMRALPDDTARITALTDYMGTLRSHFPESTKGGDEAYKAFATKLTEAIDKKFKEPVAALGNGAPPPRAAVTNPSPARKPQGEVVDVVPRTPSNGGRGGPVQTTNGGAVGPHGQNATFHVDGRDKPPQNKNMGSADRVDMPDSPNYGRPQSRTNGVGRQHDPVLDEAPGAPATPPTPTPAPAPQTGAGTLQAGTRSPADFVHDFAVDLLTAKGKNNKSAVDFKQLQTQMEASGLLHRGNVADLGRKEYSKLTEIAEALKNGQPITSGELTKLKLGNPKQAILTAADTTPLTWANAPGRFISGTLGMLTTIPKSVGNFFATPFKWDGLASGQLWTRLGVSTAVATAATMGVYDYGNGDARGLSPNKRTALNGILNAVTLDALLTSEIEAISGEQKATPLSNQTFLTLTSGQGLLSPRFVEYTRDLTGVNLTDPKYKGLAPNSLDTINLFIKIGTTLQSTEGRTFNNDKGYNAETLFAYKWAVVANLGLRGGEDAKSYDKIVKQLQGRYEEAVYNALSNPNAPTPVDVANRSYILKTFLGTDQLPEGKDLVRTLLERFADDKKAGGLGAEAFIRPAIAKFLVKNGNVKGDEKSGAITIADAKEALKKFTEIGKGQENETRELTVAARLAQAAATDTALAERRWAGGASRSGGGQTGLPSSDGASAKVKISGTRMKEILENFANDPDFPELKGKTTELAGVFNSAHTSREFGDALRLRKIPETTIESLQAEGFVSPRPSR